MKSTLWLIPLALLAMAPTAVETHQFDTLGRLTDIAYATGGSIHYTYDANCNLLTIVSTTANDGVGGRPSPVAFALGPVMPNPGAGPRRIAFAVPSRGRVTLRVMDIAGRVMTTLFDRDLEPGPYSAQFSTASWVTGEYFYRLDAAGRTRTGRMVVLR